MFDINTPFRVFDAIHAVHPSVKEFRRYFFKFDFKSNEANYVLHINNTVIHMGKILLYGDIKVPKNTRLLNPHLSKQDLIDIATLYKKAREDCRYTLPYLLNIYSKYPNIFEYELLECLPKSLTGCTTQSGLALKAIEENKPLYDLLCQQEVIKGLLK